MWFVTDPEELRNYRYSSSLKKAKADLVRRYEGLDGSEIGRASCRERV